jgi:hypothetical protein
MAWTRTNYDSLRRVFFDGFTAADVAEPLISFDAATACSEAVKVMSAHHFDAVGVRHGGLVAGYALRGDLIDGTCGEHLQAFDESGVVLESLPLSNLLLRMAKTPRLFVRAFGAVTAIVTPDDLQKPPVRMWLFGMITFIEMRMTELIERLCPAEGWRQFVSESRLEKAAALREERKVRGQDPSLLDCLQFSDKGQIIAKNEAIRDLTRFTSRRQTEQAIRALESLRNSLAHSQDLACEWQTIVMLSEEFEQVLTGTEQVRAVLGEPPESSKKALTETT